MTSGWGDVRRGLACALVSLLGVPSLANPQSAKPPRTPHLISVGYSTGQLEEPYYYALSYALTQEVKAKVKREFRTPESVASSTRTDGGELYVAFVQYVGDEALRLKLKSLVPVAYLGEGFNLFGKDGHSTLGWWGLFAPPGTPQALVARYETAATVVPRTRNFKGVMKTLTKYYRVTPLPAPELRQPATAAALKAILDAPPRVPTPSGIEAAKARAAALKAGAEDLTAKRHRLANRNNGALAAMLGAIGGRAIAASAGSSALGTALTPALQSIATGGTAIDASSLATLNSMLAPLLTGLQAGTPGGSNGLASMLQQLQSGTTAGAAGSPLAPLVQLLQANAPPAADASLLSLLTDMRGPNAAPLAANPLAQALETLTASPTGSSQLLQVLQAAGRPNASLGSVLQTVQNTFGATAGGPAGSSAGTAGADFTGDPGDFNVAAAQAQLDSDANSFGAEPGVLACVRQLKATLAEFEKYLPALPRDQAVPKLELLMWLQGQGIRIINGSCPASPSFAMRRDGGQVMLERYTTTCNQIASRPCAARLPQ